MSLEPADKASQITLVSLFQSSDELILRCQVENCFPSTKLISAPAFLLSSLAHIYECSDFTFFFFFFSKFPFKAIFYRLILMSSAGCVSLHPKSWCFPAPFLAGWINSPSLKDQEHLMVIITQSMASPLWLPPFDHDVVVHGALLFWEWSPQPHWSP